MESRSASVERPCLTTKRNRSSEKQKLRKNLKTAGSNPLGLTCASAAADARSAPLALRVESPALRWTYAIPARRLGKVLGKV